MMNARKPKGFFHYSWAVLLFLLLLSAPVYATNYYVDNTGGNNGNDGESTGQAWETIAYANTQLSAGDTLYIMAGTYEETIDPDNDGTNGNPIVYIQYSTDVVTITNVNYGADMRNHSYITIDGLVFTDTVRSWIYAENTAADHIIIQNCTFDECSSANAWAGIWMEGTGAGIQYWQVLDNTLVGVCWPNDLIMVKGTAQYNLIQGNDFGKSSHNACPLNNIDGGTMDHNIVRDNTFANEWHTNMSAHNNADYTLIEENTFEDAGIDQYNNSCGSAGDRNAALQDHPGVQHGSQYCIIRRNTFQNCGSGIASQSYTVPVCSNNKIYHNTFYDNYRTVAYGSTTHLMDENYFVNNIVSSGREYNIRYRCLHVDADNYFINNCLYNGSIYYFTSGGGGAHTVTELQTDHSAYWYDNNENNPALIDPENGDLTIPSSSPCVGAAAWLTTTNGTGSGDTTLIVDNASYFCDGWGIITGDVIQFEGQEVTATITDITGNTITIDPARTWGDGIGVHLAYEGSVPDIGYYEYVPLGGGGDEQDWPNIYIDASAGDGGVGSQADPYNDFADINWTTGGDNSVFDYYDGSPTTGVSINLNKGDEWREMLTIPQSGTAAYRLEVQSYGSGADPIIKASDLVGTWEEVYEANNGADFDGTNDSLVRGAGLTGQADSKEGVFSCWFKIGTRQLSYLIAGQAVYLGIRQNADGTFTIIGMDDGATTRLDIQTSALATGAWIHILASWDVGNGEAHLYINDSSDKTENTLTDGAINMDAGDWRVGSLVNQTSKFDGAMQEFYLNIGTHIDFSVAANRRKFIDASGLPVSLGADGSTPTGGQPIVYLKNAYGTFQTNLGSGGNFTVTGALADEGTNPGGVDSNVYEATLASAPDVVFLNGTRATKETSIAGLGTDKEWYHTGSILYQHSTSDPDTRYTSPGTEATQRDYGITATSKDYITIDGIDIRHAELIGINAITVDNWIVQNCNVQDYGDGNANAVGISFHGATGSADNCDSLLIDSNTIGTANCSVNGSAERAGIRLHGIDNSTISNNTVTTGQTTTGTQGILIYLSHAGTLSTDNIIEYNDITGCEIVGIQTRDSDGTIIRYNKIHDHKGGGIGCSYNSTGTYCYYNLIYDIQAASTQGNHFNGIDVNQTSVNGFYYNNVIYDVDNCCFTVETSADGNTIKNNILDASGNSNSQPHCIYVDASISTVTFGNNLYYDSGDADIGIWHGLGAGDHKTFAEWIALTSETGSLNTAHLMTDPASGDFTLNPHSPCVNAGTAVGFLVDYLGLLIRHAPDIGAHENQASAIF